MIYRWLSEYDKRKICSWEYEGPYSVYNLPKNYSFSAGSFYGFFLDSELIGYVNLKDAGDKVLIGIGLCPDLLGKGFGEKVLNASFSIASDDFPGKPLCLVVRKWNQRAVSCYRKVGFSQYGEPFEMNAPGGPDVFINMIKV